MQAISGMNEGFRERAHQTRALLESPSTAFVLVTGPMPDRIAEAAFFHTVLKQNHLKVAAVVVNRVHPPVPPELWGQVARLREPLKAKLEQTLDESEHLAGHDRRGIDRLIEATGDTPLVEVPRFEHDVHDVGGLWLLSQHLFGAVPRVG
jgi:anion-transporting  ArsA/GET3 family ATPase